MLFYILVSEIITDISVILKLPFPFLGGKSFLFVMLEWYMGELQITLYKYSQNEVMKCGL